MIRHTRHQTKLQHNIPRSSCPAEQKQAAAREPLLAHAAQHVARLSPHSVLLHSAHPPPSISNSLFLHFISFSFSFFSFSRLTAQQPVTAGKLRLCPSRQEKPVPTEAPMSFQLPPPFTSVISTEKGLILITFIGRGNHYQSGEMRKKVPSLLQLTTLKRIENLMPQKISRLVDATA